MTRKTTPTIRSRTYGQAAEEAFVELVVAAYPFIERSLRPAMRAKWDAAPEESRVAMVIRLLELDTFSDYEIEFIFAEHVRETLARDKFRHRPGERKALSSASTQKWR